MAIRRASSTLCSRRALSCSLGSPRRRPGTRTTKKSNNSKKSFSRRPPRRRTRSPTRWTAPRGCARRSSVGRLSDPARYPRRLPARRVSIRVSPSRTARRRTRRRRRSWRRWAASVRRELVVPSPHRPPSAPPPWRARARVASPRFCGWRARRAMRASRRARRARGGRPTRSPRWRASRRRARATRRARRRRRTARRMRSPRSPRSRTGEATRRRRPSRTTRATRSFPQTSGIHSSRTATNKKVLRLCSTTFRWRRRWWTPAPWRRFATPPPTTPPVPRAPRAPQTVWRASFFSRRTRGTRDWAAPPRRWSSALSFRRRWRRWTPRGAARITYARSDRIIGTSQTL